MSIPDNVAAEIAAKRTPDAEESPENKEDNKDKKPEPKEEGDKTKKSTEKKDDAPEKKGKAAKPKNGQSIAQVAEAADDEDDEDDDDDEGEDDDHDGDQKKPGSQKRSGLFKEFMGLKRELKDQKRANKEMDKQYREVASALGELVEVVKDLKGNKNAQRDEIEEFAEEWGLDKEGLKKLTGILEKNLSTKFKPTKAKDDDEDEEDDEPRKKKSKSDPKKSEINTRKVELAIEAEYEDYLDSFPQVKGKINLKAIKRFIIGDEENLEKSFADIVAEMYPGVLDSKGGVDGGSDIGDGEDDGEKMDFNDPKVLSQLDKNPKLKAKYHDDLLSRVKGLKS